MFFSRFSSSIFPSALQRRTHTRNHTDWKQELERASSEGWIVKRASYVWHVFHPDLNTGSPHLHRMRNITMAKAAFACILCRSCMVLAKSVTSYLINTQTLLKTKVFLKSPQVSELSQFKWGQTFFPLQFQSIMSSWTFLCGSAWGSTAKCSRIPAPNMVNLQKSPMQILSKAK